MSEQFIPGWPWLDRPSVPRSVVVQLAREVWPGLARLRGPDMSITTEEAERLAQTHDLVRFTLGMKAPEHDLTAAAVRSLAAERDALRAEVEKLRAALDAAARVLHKAGEQFAFSANQQWAQRCFDAHDATLGEKQ
jgi:hypothetical protein